MNTISVIIPTYNRLPLLKETLNSFFSQSLTPDEIIVVDNQSTDGTYDYLKNELHQKVLVVRNVGNFSPGAARNTGLKVATGKYIKFFDSDDLLTRNTLEVQKKLLETSQREFVYSPYFYAAKNRQGVWEQTDPAILNYFPFDESRALHYWMITKNLFIPIPGMLFKKELLDEVGLWREDVTASEDWDYLFRISQLESKPAHTNECAFLYRIHGKQTTESNLNHQQRDKDKTKVLKGLYKKLKENDTGWTERSLFENKLHQIYRITPAEHPLKAELRKYDSAFHRMVWQYVRLDNKIGRMKTKTQWQPIHGPFVSKEKFTEYLKMIETQSSRIS